MATTGDAVLGQFKPTEHNDSEECCCGKKLKVGIIGTGWIAEAHIESYLRMPDVEIVAGADLIDGKAEKFFKRYGVENVRLYPRILGIQEEQLRHNETGRHIVDLFR